MRLRSPILPLVFGALVASCKACDEGPKRPADAEAPEAAPPREPAAEAGPVDAAVPEDSGGSSSAPADEDGGGSPCALAYGPAEQPFRGPAALRIAGGALELVANDSGRPRMFSVRLDAKTPPPPSSFVGMRWPPCELAGKFVYCQGPGGAITRTTLGGSDTRTVVSKSRAGSRIAAAPLGKGDHAVVAFLDTRQTTEGSMIQAFVALDDDVPMRLSEDGAGATTMRMAARGEQAVFVYLDTRTAMVPVHARTLRLEGKDLALGEDAVAFVGGAPERGVDLALGGVSRRTYVVLPMPRETTEFGMAAIPVLDPPKEDVAATWSLYPNGLDPAPVGATMDGWIARVRPKEAMVGARRVLELGRLGEDGSFRSLGIIAEGKPITDVALVSDPRHGVWILYGDAKATWLERRVCP